MRKILFILLVVGIPLQAQYSVKDVGRYVKKDRTNVTAQADNIPGNDTTTYTPPPGPPFDGSIYKEWTFAEATAPAENTDARWRTFMGSSNANQSVDAPSFSNNDSCIIQNNDTIWKVTIRGKDYGYKTNGVQIFSDIHINGSDASADTLTYANFTYWMKLGSNWNWANDGKFPGLAGRNRDHDRFPPGGGVRGPLCEDCPTPGTEVYCYYEDDGWSARGNFHHEGSGVASLCSDDGDIGFYVYHQGFSFDACDTEYGATWNPNTQRGIDLTWQYDHWYKITHRIVLNTAGQYDGILEWYRNDTCYMNLSGVKFREYSDIYIDFFFFDVFQGGEMIDCFDTYMNVYFDDFILWIDDDRRGRALYDVITTPSVGTPNTDYN